MDLHRQVYAGKATAAGSKTFCRTLSRSLDYRTTARVFVRIMSIRNMELKVGKIYETFKTHFTTKLLQTKQARDCFYKKKFDQSRKKEETTPTTCFENQKILFRASQLPILSSYNNDNTNLLFLSRIAFSVMIILLSLRVLLKLSFVK